MTTLTKLADIMRGVNGNISGLKAATERLSLSDKKALLEILSKDVEAAADVASAPKKRLAAVQAAAVSTDQRTKEAFTGAVKMLKRLGTEIDAICASGDVSSLSSKMEALRWDSVQRTQLQLYLGIIGAVAV
jgi:hypothetical protein